MGVTLMNPYAVAAAGGGGGGGAITPLDVNTKLWFRPSALALSNNALISAAPDQSPSGNDLSCPPGFEPTNKTNQLDGKAVARWSAGQTLATAGNISSAVTNFAVFCVARCTDATVARTISRPFEDGVRLYASSEDVIGKTGLILPGVTFVTTTLNTPAGFVIYAYRRRAGVLQFFVNGGAPLGSTASAPRTPGGPLSLGDIGGNFMVGDIADWFQFDEDPTDAIMNGLGAGLVEEYPSLTWTDI